MAEIASTSTTATITTSTASATIDFWSALENAIKNQPNNLTDLTNSNSKNVKSDNMNDNDEINKLLNALKPSEPISNRIKALEDILTLIDSYNLNETLINFLLKSIRDLLNINQTPFETRKVAYEFLIELIKKKQNDFHTFLIRNYLLSLIISTNKTSSNCLFLNLINSITGSQHHVIQSSVSTSTQNKPMLSQQKSNQQQSTKTISIDTNDNQDDIKYRFELFFIITKNASNFDHLDPELTNECLIYFLQNSKHLTDKNEKLFHLFKNLIDRKYFQYIDDNLLLLLTRFILNFSFLVTNQMNNTVNITTTKQEVATTKNFSSLAIENHQLTQLNTKQIMEIKLCINLLAKIIDELTTIDCINYVVLCLCELLDIVWLSSQLQINNNVFANDLNELNNIIGNIYECMNKLFISSIGNCAIFTFFSEIFPPHKKNQIHRTHQINGALMHIKQIFEDFKSSKLKNPYLIKELHLNCLMYLPNALKSYSTEINQSQKFVMFEHILNLTTELVNLATHRDLFMCLLTFNSRQFLIEIVEQFSDKILENETLIRKYAELLNLLDKKEVFAYKTSKQDTTAGQNDDMTWLFQRFKESFYDLVNKFPYANKYLKENCINNCIEFYFQRKLLPSFGKETIKQIRIILEKYLNIKNRHSINVRKFIIETMHRRLKEYYGGDQKIFTEDIISQAILPLYEKVIIEDDEYFHSNEQNNDYSVSDLIEMKYFLVTKLIELTYYCNIESSMHKIIKIFDQIIQLEKTSCIELLTIKPIYSNSNSSSSSSQSNLILSPPSATQSLSQSLSIQSSQQQQQQSNPSQSLNYLNKIINQGLIEIFEKHFSNTNNEHNFSLCCVEIYNILTKYLEYYYTHQYNHLFTTNTSASTSIVSNSNSLIRTYSSSFADQPATVIQQQQTQIAQLKFFNYYANIRKDIFEFLLRIRSDKFKRLLLLNRNNRRKLTESKFLLITILNQTRYDDINEHFTRMNKCQIDFGRLLRLIENCLEKEIDWNVLMRVLNDLPYVLQYETDLIIKSDFIQHLFKFFYKKEINVFRNKPDNLQKVDYIAKFYPLIASIILYHSLLDKQSQENILQYFAIGINSNRNRFCLETLTIAFTEMHETNSIQCGDILLKLSQFSPSQAMAQPVLELLSTMSDFKKLEFIFGRKELYISVLAIAIKYTNPLKFNSFIIQLAHYVICIWFIKCKPEIRKNYASFTFKGLHKEVILELELSKDTKSPNKLTTNDTDNIKEESVLTKSQSSVLTSSTNSNTNNKNILTDSMKLFYKDLVEITMDFMSNNMYFDSSINTQLTSNHNRNEFFVDIYSNTLRSNSMITSGDGQQKQKGLTKVWLAGNKIIEIKTGLFSNICLEDPSSYLLRKQRVNSVSINSTTQQQTKPVKIPTQAIDIPNQQLINESIASSEQSSATSISNNNSFSSVSLTSNYKGTPSNGSNTVISNNKDKNIHNNNNNNNNKNDSETDGTNKSEKDFFDETIDSKNTQEVGGSLISEKDHLENEILSSTETPKISSSNSYESNKNNDSSSISTATSVLQTTQRRNKIPKRRYKSGLPLTADRSSNNNDGFDFTEESYLRQYYESSMLNKQSKDDSSINIDMSSNKNLSNNSACYMTNEYTNQKLNHSHVHHSHHLKHHHNHHHHNYRSSDDTSTSRVSLEHQDSFESNDTVSSQQQSNKNICNQNCWCNNLVEITCRYPTKIITYVSLIENNSSTSHFINTALFDKLVKSNKLSKLNELAINNSNINTNNNIEKPILNTLAKIAANAIESRRNSQLSRISESSMLSQEMPNIPSSGSSSICDQIQNIETSTVGNNDSIIESKSNRFFLNSDINTRRSLLSRKGSFDLSSISSASSDNQPTSRLRQQTTILNQQLDNSKFLNSSYNPAIQNQSSNSSLNKFSSSQNTTAATSLDPSQVFLQLFQNQYIYNDDKDQPILIPENENIHRSIKILDYMPAYMLHKVGVIYVGKNQANDEKAILANSTGSIRYKHFINGLGNLIYLKEMDTLRYYSGGMETDGSLGDFTLLWSDGIVQISFHVATMMLLKDDDSNTKKRHIGNDPTIIVYNESGEEYQFNMIKGDINCICIEIIPLDSNTNIVKVKTNNEIAQSQWFTHSDPKFISDSNLALIVRKMALHASMASRIYRSQKDNNLFGDKWYDRLKQINRIRKLTKEHYAKQQQQQQQQQSQQNKSSSSGYNMTDNNQNKMINTSTATTTTTNSNTSSLNSVLNQSDFTNYI